MEGTGEVTYEYLDKLRDIFEDLVLGWPQINPWTKQPSHVHEIYHTGGKRYNYRRRAITASKPQVLEGTIVEQSAPTPPAGLPRPTPKVMAGTRHPAIQLREHRQEGP